MENLEIIATSEYSLNTFSNTITMYLFIKYRSIERASEQ